MSNFNYKLKVSPNIKFLLSPLLTIAIIVFVLILFVPQGISRIDKSMKEYKKNQKQEEILNEKLETLRVISADSLDPEDVSVIALPSKNPGIWAVSQIRRFTKEYDIKIVELSLSKAKNVDGIKSSGLIFEFDANDYQSFVSVLNDLIVMLPYTSLNTTSIKRSVNQQGQENFTGGMEISLFWSDFPTNLPPLNEPVKELTNEETSLIGVISNYKQPLYTELQPAEPIDRPKPFD